MIPLLGFINMLFPAFVRFFYYTMQLTSFVYKKTNIIWLLLLLAMETVTMQTVYEFFANTKKLKIVATIFSRFLLILQFFYLGIAMYDLLFNYALMMRCAADIPTAYYVLNQPVMFDNARIVEGMPDLNVKKEFAKQAYEG